MKTLLTFALFLTNLFTFNAFAQMNSLSSATAIAKVEVDDLAIVSGATAITFDIENIENANWFTTLIDDYTALGSLNKNAKIQGIVLTMNKITDTNEIIYDDVVKLFVPTSLSYDGVKNQTNEKSDLVSENKATNAPWNAGKENAKYGTAFDNWGLGNVTLNDIQQYGLGIEFKADSNTDKIKLTNIKATIYFENTIGSLNKVSSFR